jgi:hypothetical protein
MRNIRNVKKLCAYKQRKRDGRKIIRRGKGEREEGE